MVTEMASGMRAHAPANGGSGETAPRRRPFDPRILTPAILAPLAVVFLVSPRLFVDPFVGAASYPVLLGESESLRAAALASGHWLTWAWSLLDLRAAGAILGGLFVLLWSLASAFVACGIFRGDRTPVRAALTAAALALGPPVAELAHHAPAMLPATALVTLYAGIVLIAPRRLAETLLLVFVPLGLMTEGLAALTILAVLLAAPREARDRASLTRSVVLFVLGVALGALAVFALNRAQHGVFGLARPEGGELPPIVDRLGVLERLLLDAAPMFLGPVPVAGVVPIVAALGLLFLLEPRQADRIFGGLGLGMAVVIGKTLLTGEPPLLRELLFVWVFLVCLLAWAARAAPDGPAAASFAILIGTAGALGGAHLYDDYGLRGRFQAASRALAEDIRAGFGPEGVPARIVVAGSPDAVEGSRVLTEFGALADRLSLVLGAEVIQCPSDAPACRAHRAALIGLPQRPAEGWVARAVDGTGLVRLPDGVFSPARDR